MRVKYLKVVVIIRYSWGLNNMTDNVYKDTMHELVKPILTDTPTDRKKRRKQATQLRKAAKQERLWAASADAEGRSEHIRAMKLPRGDPFRKELLSDSRIAYGFGKLRLQRADKLDQLANNLLKSLDKKPLSKHKKNRSK